MKWAYCFLLIIGSLLVVSSCKKEIDHNKVNVKRKISFLATEPSLDSRTYYLRWGSIRMPVLDNSIPPNQATPYTIPFDTIEQNFYQAFQLFKGNKEVKTDLITIDLENTVSGISTSFYLNKNNNFSLEKNSNYANTAMAYCKQGARISFTAYIDEVPLKVPPHRLVGDSLPYYPPIVLRPLAYLDTDIYDFQLYNSEGRKTVVRIDTTTEKGMEIYKQYQFMPNKYEIYHIPGFQTIRRFYTDTEKIQASKNFTRLNLLDEKSKILPLEMERFPEYANFKNVNVYLQWGDLKTEVQRNEGLTRDGNQAATLIKDRREESKNLEILKTLDSDSLQLFINEKPLAIKRFDMWIVQENGEDYRILSHQVQHPEIQKIIQALSPRSSIFFDNLLIQDKTNRIQWFPLSFVLNFP